MDPLVSGWKVHIRLDSFGILLKVWGSLWDAFDYWMEESDLIGSIWDLCGILFITK